jgi:hypothetical protein
MSLRGSVRFSLRVFIETTFSLREDYGLQMCNVKVAKKIFVYSDKYFLTVLDSSVSLYS